MLFFAVTSAWWTCSPPSSTWVQVAGEGLWRGGGVRGDQLLDLQEHARDRSGSTGICCTLLGDASRQRRRRARRRSSSSIRMAFRTSESGVPA